jgi:hypothetical protein
MNSPVKIHIPTEEENRAALEEFFAREKRVKVQRVQAALLATEALDRLCKDVLTQRSGQCYKVRALLFSIWNGKPASLSELLGLDWELRQDVCAVLLAFGYEDAKHKFFYDALQRAVTAAGQWNWFLEERFEYKLLEEYAKTCREAAEEAE